MFNSKTLLKFLFALGVWSLLLIGVVKIQSNHVVLEEYPHGPLNGRLLLQKDNKYSFEATSTTTDRILPSDVLVDNRQSKYKWSKRRELTV